MWPDFWMAGGLSVLLNALHIVTREEEDVLHRDGVMIWSALRVINARQKREIETNSGCYVTPLLNQRAK